MRDIAKNIRSLRIAKNMTQDELAEKLFVTRQTVSNYETGKTRPDVDMLARIAEVLETDVNTLIYGIPTPPNRKREYLITAVCMITVLVHCLIYCYLVRKFDFIARMYYGARPTMFLTTVYRPLFVMFVGWTLMQILGCFTNLKPFSGPRIRYRRILLWMSFSLFYLAQAPVILGLFIPLPFPRWWNAISWFVVVAASKHLWILAAIGAGLWLTGFPLKKNNEKESC